MTAAPVPRAAGSPQSRSAFGEHAWFLHGDSPWTDTVWQLEPTSTLEEARPVQLRWDFTLIGGRRFTDRRYAPLLEASRQLIALIRTCSLTKGLSQRGSTVRCYFTYLRELVRWMDRAAVTRFAQLDASALLQFHRSISERPGKRMRALAPTTVQKYLYLLAYLYRFRDELDDALQIDPFPGQSLGAAAKVREGDIPRLPYTPQGVAVPLIQGAIEVVGHASQVLRTRDVYADAIARAQQQGLSRYVFSEEATRALQEWQRSQPPVDMTAIATPSELAQRIDMLYAACFVVVAYLVGPRVSEILHLQAGCVHDCGGDQAGGVDSVTAIVGTIFKGEAQYHGRRHEWVAPPAAVQAIAVLESLSAPHRARSDRSTQPARRTRMVRASTGDDASKSPEQRLRDALQELTTGTSAEVPTATALCELAGVSRNALYRYHADVLHELHKLQHRRRRSPSRADRALQRLHDENAELHRQADGLAALVDHYFAAWQEACSVLQRRERELAELRRSVKPKLVTIRK